MKADFAGHEGRVREVLGRRLDSSKNAALDLKKEFQGLSTSSGRFPPLNDRRLIDSNSSKKTVTRLCVAGMRHQTASLRSDLLSGKATLAAPDELEQDIAVTFAVSTTKPSLCACMNSCSAKDHHRARRSDPAASL